MHTTDTGLFLPSSVKVRATRTRALRSLVRIAGVVLASLVAIAAAGAAYEAIAGLGDASAYPPAGQLVDVGGHSLHLDCRGEGSPTVVMDAGLGGASLDWVLVQSELAATTRVCTYDRAGMGWSEPGPLPRTPARIAEELYLLLENAGVPGPYVLVGHSLAGKNVRMFAAAHPDEVAGMVLIDARSERMDLAMSAADHDALTGAFKAQAMAFSLARRLGLARLFAASLVGAPLVPPHVALEMELLQTGQAALNTMTEEGRARSADDEALAARTLGAMPLVVIAASVNMSGLPGWAEAQDALTALSTNGSLVVADSGHYVQLEQPALVVESVQAVLAAARAQP